MSRAGWLAESDRIESDDRERSISARFTQFTFENAVRENAPGGEDQNMEVAVCEAE
jgi:hypothetical protein